jgi:hypothetical protein
MLVICCESQSSVVPKVNLVLLGKVTLVVSGANELIKLVDPYHLEQGSAGDRAPKEPLGPLALTPRVGGGIVTLLARWERM